ncbi:phosphogluconate dehydrogenase (NAD(+)-dependent, decarboxylating) [Chamaesiphon polymorphus]|uniref:6-phosphogluconate dehydrogenase (Decarboxylating) n=1 Tax=Chamaesiphon polymorphus CCALA 037 TaxID=2107692 RepID=A0A2T1GKS8_9CYAN|nr:decarboxylating 6-phosphogluconate dehydrogenase [Chamaesiphon polymorphus]PSB58437.1 6-phosphogluconate dehydrogenase (decarboxylating) [Chamaesiphon polymorphus CCALA 037]
MQIGVIGLGRMGANIVRRLLRNGHDCVVYNRSPEKVQQLVAEGAIGTATLHEFVSQLAPPRAIWLMVPAGEPTEQIVTALSQLLAPEDIIIDGGNSYYIDDIRRSKELAKRSIHYLDVGTSGGVWGLERGYCMMIGGAMEIVKDLDPIFKTLAPGRGDITRTPGREKVTGTAEDGYLHCGTNGAGHFVKMVHNGIEYGLMAAYAEGLNILHHANIGKEGRSANAETAPLQHPEHYQYDFNLAEIAEVWRRGSVVASWLLDLTAIALLEQPTLETFSGQISDSGEGRWTIAAAIDEGTPVPVLSAALYQRFSSRGEDEFAAKLLSAMRFQFGGHVEQHQ